MNALKNPVVAISSEFMNAFAAVPKKMQNKMLEFITKFRANPTAASINYEKIIQFKDQSLRSVRIDQTYRGIVKKPEKGNVYMLLWVDHHDKAYAWAQNKKCSINPETGSLQIYDVDDIIIQEAEQVSSAQGENINSLFSSVHDRHLVKLGIPQELLPLVRAMYSDEDLDQSAGHLPAEAHDALTALAAGYTINEVLNECGTSAGGEKTVDTDDFESALNNPDSKSRFYVVEDDIVLQEILEAPLEKWRVFLPQGITSFLDYIKAPRVGRGVPLTRPNRKAVWAVFEEYRVLLNENRLREPDDAMRDACALIKEKGNILPYVSVIVDEAQDMGAQAFKLMRQIEGDGHKNDLFIVGDAHQRIYRHKVVLGQCGIKIIGRGRKLRINYRTTEENRCWAVRLLKGIRFDDLDGGQDDQKGYKSLLHGAIPVVEHFSSFQAEITYIIDCLKAIENNGENLHQVCLVARTHGLLQQYEGALKGQGLETYFVRRNEAEDRRKSGVRLATMHRVKGLEFDRVIIAGVNAGTVPLEGAWSQSNDQVIQKESENQEKALLYVAATRAKKTVVVTSFENPSRFLS